MIVKSPEDQLAADEEIRGKLEINQNSRLWCCKECAYTHSRKEVVTKHVDTKHMNLCYRCDNCHKLTPTQHALKEHMRTSHKDSSAYYSAPFPN